jgi:hypothetical protein
MLTQELPQLINVSNARLMQLGKLIILFCHRSSFQLCCGIFCYSLPAQHTASTH